jgi:hypothetical protein
MKTPFSRALALATFLLHCTSSALTAVETRELHVYFARAVVEAKVDGKNPEELLRKYLPKDDPSVTLKKLRNTGLFEIGATASSRKAAAQRANQVAMAIKAAFSKDSSGAELIIRERAEAPTRPVDPKQQTD